MDAADSNVKAVWIGPSDSEELSLARRSVESRLDTVASDGASDEAFLAVRNASSGRSTAGDQGTAGPLLDREPTFAFLSADIPRLPVHETALRLARRWPLCRFVGVGSSLCEGRRRSGPPLPGIEEIPWHDLPGRLECWLDDLQARRPGWLGQPATVRREDRLLEGIRHAPADDAEAQARRTIAVAAARTESLEGIVDLLASFGEPPVHATVGRPSMETLADVLLWECPESAAAELPWLSILAAHRPETHVVLLESFPRGDRTLEAIRAGAAWVLGRPTPADVLFGTLRRLAFRGLGSGLGPAVAAG